MWIIVIAVVLLLGVAAAIIAVVVSGNSDDGVDYNGMAFTIDENLELELGDDCSIYSNESWALPMEFSNCAAFIAAIESECTTVDWQYISV